MINNIISSEYFTDDDKKFHYLATSTLEKLTEICDATQEKLQKMGTEGGSVFISSADHAYGIKDFKSIQKNISTNYKNLILHPAKVKVVIEFIDSGEIQEWYFAQFSPPQKVHAVASYNSPKGRIASLDIGITYDLGEETTREEDNEKYIKIIQKTILNPVKVNSIWNSTKNIYIDSVKQEHYTIHSLREVIQGNTASQDEDILSQLLQNHQSSNTIPGIVRGEIISLSLRSQYILDAVQDKIFRLPLKSTLFLSGSAGTGKTTTLIRRLGQKLNMDEEAMSLENINLEKLEQEVGRFENSWIMFTPTELLKNYLKEAFNREMIPAPDKNIKTWDTYRHELGRGACKILQTPNFKSGFIFDEEFKAFNNNNVDSVPLYFDFKNWILEKYKQNILNSLENIKKHNLSEEFYFFHKICDIQSYTNSNELILNLIKNTITYKKDIIEQHKNKKNELNTIIKNELNKILKNDNTFLNRLYSFIESLLHENANDQENTEYLMSPIDEDYEQTKNENLIQKSINSYTNIIIHLTQLKFERKTKSSHRNKKIIDWLDQNVPDPHTLEMIYEIYSTIRIIRSIIAPANNLMDYINRGYREFRKIRQEEKKWYNENSVMKDKVNYQELDVLLLIKLDIAKFLLNSSDIARNSNDSWLSKVSAIQNNHFAQIFVDEAPDFSPVQLACMSLLSHKETNSFFACGDFNQRLTPDGTTNIAEMQQLFAYVKIHEEKVVRPYRQLEKLYEFSSKVLTTLNGGSCIPNTIDTPQPGGFAPTLGKKLSGLNLAEWIADRIVEIEHLLKLDRLPSTAILVPNEDCVRPIAENLKAAILGKTSALIEACTDGKSQGNDAAIRVFDIKHIKGLEFEAVFFVSIDEIEKIYPELLGNYLYVGTTRAAHFLGITYENKLPNFIEKNLFDSFIEEWK